MSLVPLELNMQVLVFILIPFIVGLVLGFTFKKIRNIMPKWHDNTSAIRAIVSEYTRRLEKYENAIADLRARLDLIQSRSHEHTMTQQLHFAPIRTTVTSSDMSQDQSQQPSFYERNYKKIESTRKTRDHISDSYDVQNGTTDYILKLLNERLMTSREVQQAIGRSREHTSRLMKKLYEYGFITRDTNTKPFKYALTEASRLRLKEGYHVIQGAVLDTTNMSHHPRPTSTPG